MNAYFKNIFAGGWSLFVGMGILLVLLASTLLNVAYFAPVTYKAFFGKRPEGEETGIREAPLSMWKPRQPAR